MDKQLIAITCGDPAGIGPEIISKWIYNNCELIDEYCFIGPSYWLNKINVKNKIQVGNNNCNIILGKPTLESASIAFQALKIAAIGCIEKKFSAVVTAPINKYLMQKIQFKYPGQTEFFADFWRGSPIMGFVGSKIRVILVTWHIPLIKIVKFLNKESILKAITSASWLCQSLGIKTPKIAFCGLNPHAGEEGLIGKEEKTIINPILKSIGFLFPGLHTKALPADTIFWRHLQGEFDVVVALYHDQGLCAIKTIDFDNAVNITLGLSFIRTSPDHGTAYELAGKGIANCLSLGNAIKLAKQLS